MTLKDLLKKRDKLASDDLPSPAALPVDEFTFIRTDTHTEEVIAPPGLDDETEAPHHKRFTPFRKGSNASTRSTRSQLSTTAEEDVAQPNAPVAKRRLSQRLHLTPNSRSSSHSSVIVPVDLPNITDDYNKPIEEKEAQWEERATVLAKSSPIPRRESESYDGPPQVQLSHLTLDADTAASSRPKTMQRAASDHESDETIQDAIRLHESGQLKQSTEMFGRLASRGNVLSQVLYGLALRHGWGCNPNPTLAITYLSEAASNSAAIEDQALKAGMKKGGAAKGELTLAMFELANCFRNGWGVEKDAVAARLYYETAANLGDTDAMNEAAWCYLEGFGGKKDKFKAAQFLRQAEGLGVKTLGNTWIWKDKYNPPST